MSAGDHAELKGLETRRQTADRELKGVMEELSKVQSRVSIAQAEIRKIDERLFQLKRSDKDIIISEHAILRFLERVKKIDIEATKKEILSDLARAQAKALGNGTFPVSATHRVKVKDNTVVTILTPDEK